jgi:hypothetical protein
MATAMSRRSGDSATGVTTGALLAAVDPKGATMNPILAMVNEQLQGGGIDRIASQVGASPQQTQAAVQTALPALLAGLQRNSATPDGAASLLGALDRDHDGSVLDDLAGFLGSGPSPADARSVDHIFGPKRPAVEDAVAQRSGLQAGQVMQILAMLAPLVLGALARSRRQGGGAGQSSGSGGGGLGDILGGALGGALGGGGPLGGGGGGGTGQLPRMGPAPAPESTRGAGGGGGLGGVLGGMLDRDNDGSFLDDLLEGAMGGGGRGRGQADAGRETGGGGLGDILGDLMGGGGRRGDR